MSRRIEALDETAAEVSPRSSQPSQKKRTVKLASNLFLNLPEGLSELSLSRIGKMRMIACFIIDGSDRCALSKSLSNQWLIGSACVRLTLRIYGSTCCGFCRYGHDH